MSQLRHPELLSELGEGSPDLTPAAAHMALHGLFSSSLRPRRHLLVVDGAWDERLVERVYCPAMQGAILVTAAESLWPGAPTQQLQQGGAEARAVAQQLLEGVLAGGQPDAAAEEVGAQAVPLLLVLCLGSSSSVWVCSDLCPGSPTALGPQRQRLPHPPCPECTSWPARCLQRQAATPTLPEVHTVACSTQVLSAGIAAVAERSGGNLLAASVLGAVMRGAEPEEWQALIGSVFGGEEEESKAILNAVQLADVALAAAGRDGRAAAAAFGLLRHLQAQRPLPLPLLQLAWQVLQPEEAGSRGVREVLDRLVAASLLSKVGAGI